MLKAAFRFVSEMNQLSNCFVDGSLFESPSSTIFFYCENYNLFVTKVHSYLG